MSVWAQIPEFPDYAVSSAGRVMRIRNSYMNQSKAGKVLKPITCAGYLAVNLRNRPSGKVIYIHRLVAQNFIPNPDNKPIVNHIDGDRKNPHIENLEWVTNSENLLHAYAIGIAKGTPRTITLKKMDRVRRLRKKGLPQHKIAKIVGISQQGVSRILANIAWRHYPKHFGNGS